LHAHDPADTLAFLIAALSDLDILTADVPNAYLNAQTEEKICAKAGLEFGLNAGMELQRLIVITKLLLRLLQDLNQC
jgi:hypothetical protein